MRRFYAHLAVLVVGLGMVGAVVASPPASAFDINPACNEANCKIVKANENKAADQAKGIIDTALGILGGLAGIMIVVGGLKYVTAGGDQQKLTSAKHTVLYSTIGLVVAIMAAGIVHFVVVNFAK